jgi:hypothetical protein
MHSLTNKLGVPEGATLAVVFGLTVGYFYLSRDKRFTLLERLYFLFCKRDIKEALLEHELLEERMNIPPPFFYRLYP